MESEVDERRWVGRRRVPGKALAALSVAVAVVAAACGGSDGNKEAPETPSPQPTPSVAASPTPSPTPDPLGPRPIDPAAAQTALERYFGPEGSRCTELLTQRWEVVCATGDVDGDGKPDLALLVPLDGPGFRSPSPAAVFVKRTTGTGLERFPSIGSDGDESPLGRLLFSVIDRTGDNRAELVYLTKRCTASTCNALVEVQSWDGTAWRDRGPADLGMESLDRLDFLGRGAASKLVLHGGRLSSIAAGPTRARTVTYAYDGVRYSESDTQHEKPEYLYHAILDADELVEEAKYKEAIAAYAAAIEDKDLKDWRREVKSVDGRSQLAAYALFRIAIATAADAQNPTAALDAVIMGTDNAIFQRAAQSFRQGLQEGGTVHAGCLSATSYLATPPIPQELSEMFDYGTANPRKGPLDMCPF